MKNIYKRIVCLGLCGIMVSSSIAFAADNKANGTTKDETVYVMMNSDGSIKKQIVSSWIHSDNGVKGISEKVSLTDIKNVKGDIKPTINGENLSWDIKDNDIYYQGSSTKTPPISMKISYKLDGKEISAKDIAGKTGKADITIKYNNNEKSTAMISNKSKEIFTPFFVTSVCDFKTENFKNIKCNNAKIMSDGTNEIVTIATLPGLKENLGDSYGLLKNVAGIELTDEFVISADVTDFALGSIISAATSNIPVVKSDKPADANKVSKGLNDFINGVNQLDAGSKKLNEGATKLAGGVGQYTKAINDMILLVNGKLPAVEKQLAGIKTGLTGDITKLATDMQSTSTEMQGIMIQIKTLMGKIDEFEKSGAVSPAVVQSLKETATSMYTQLMQHIATLGTIGDDIKKVAGTAGKMSGDLTTQYSQIKAKLAPLQKELAAKSAQLNDGAKQVAGGADALSKGTSALKGGKDKIANDLNGKVDANYLFAIKDVLVEKAQSYDSYSGKPDNCESSVKFVMKTDEIKKETVQVTADKKPVEEKKGFWQSIGDFFENLFN